MGVTNVSTCVMRQDEYEAQAAQLQQLQEEVHHLRRRDQTLWSALAASGQLVPEVEREIERETAREAAHKAAREGKAAESARASAALRVLAKRAGGDEVDVESRSDLTRTSTGLRAAADAELTLCEITIGSKRERVRDRAHHNSTLRPRQFLSRVLPISAHYSIFATLDTLSLLLREQTPWPLLYELLCV
eukprot:6200939-Pleurochrysis_carterae.AAC.2